ncbi:MAG TPA: septal ring lytic transglycosylase RlpA family protein [bacterium]|nr:septal ring lytic transglycosylase RlpA family protein [bacterium]HOC88529.1 septal ring lytic transglycosylase RlpA family protein [bacterium]HOZ21018.1 septal ring lytic transglycosylase RlpA family protein [bacterium]
MKRRSLLFCSLFTLIVSCYPNTRWWDDGADYGPEEQGQPGPASEAAQTREPRAAAWRETETGIASFMADELHGRMTASGELYDMRNLTAAHPSLPFGTLVEVVNLANGRSVKVRINDRGPYVAGRIIDLSFQAARDLELTERGSGKVEVRVIEMPR